MPRKPRPLRRTGPGRYDERDQLAWAAGLVDGEGCFRMNIVHGYANPRFTIAQAHPEVLERFREIVGFGKLYGPYPKQNGHKAMWQYFASGFQQTQAIFALLWPWLGSVKREQGGRVLQV